jgi:hypothetical protein
MSGSREMLTALFERGSGTYIELRCINRTSGKVNQHYFEPDELATIEEVAQACSDAVDVYFGVAMRTRRSGGKDAVGGVQALWADIDTPEATLELTMFELPPSIVVASGSPGGYHAYWLLDKPLGVSEAEELLRLLAHRLGSDLAVTDASRVLRVPDTLNHKSSPPSPVVVRELEGHVYASEDVRAALTSQPPAASDASPAKSDGRTSRVVKRVLDKLAGVRESGGGWIAHCPGHDDQRPSLSISEAESGDCLLNCFANCDTEDVVHALGLELRDLFLNNESTGRKDTVARLVELVDDGDVELFHDSRGRPFATIRVADHQETWPVDSTGFNRWLRFMYFRAHGCAVPAEKQKAAIELFAARAEFEGSELPVGRRVAGDLERIVIDLGDPAWRAVEVTRDGWTVVERPDTRFQREAGMLSLPSPGRDGSLDGLRTLFNAAEPDDWTRVLGALIGAFHPTGPYLVTLIAGPPGSGKSVAMRQLAGLIDPFDPQAVVGKPKPHDLLVAASRTWLTAIDNVPFLTRELSDMLAVLSTGAGDRRRSLYTNDDLFALVAKGPVVLTALTQIVRVPDLISRANFVRLDQLPDHRRRREDEVVQEFKSLRPSVFGALLDALAGALANVDGVNLSHLPRMADVATLVTAAEHVIGIEPGTFCDALEAGQQEARGRAVEAAPFVEAVIRVVQARKIAELSMTDLLSAAAEVPGIDSKARAWPRTANAGSHQLDEHATTLADHGITITRHRRPGGNRDRYIKLVLAGRDKGHPGTMPDEAA